MKDLTTGKVSRHIFNFAMPMLIGNVFQQLYNVVDSIIVGNFIGKQALAAVGASFPIIFTLISLIIGIASGAMVVISQYFGAKDIEKVKRTISTTYIFIFVASFLVSVVGIYFSEEIFRLMQLPEEIMPQAVSYLKIYMTGMVAFFGFNGTAAVLRGLGDSKTPLYFLIVATLLNILFDILFVVVFEWGIEGAAFATVLSQTFAFIAAITYVNKKHPVIQLRFKGLVFDKELFIKSIKIGLPSGIQQTVVALGMLAIMGIVNTFGTDVIAGYSVAVRLDSIAVMPAMNFSAALATFTGQNMGANKPDRVKKGLLSTIYMSGAVSIFVTVLLLLFGKFLMGLFTNDPEVIRIGYEYLCIVSAFYVVFSILFSYNGVLRGAGDTLIPMFITFISLWVLRIPSAFLLSNHIGEKGIWWAVPIGVVAGAIMSYFYYKTGRYKRKAVVKYPATAK